MIEMKNTLRVMTLVALAACLTGCGDEELAQDEAGSGTNPSEAEQSDGDQTEANSNDDDQNSESSDDLDEQPFDTSEIPAPIGGCVILNPSGEVPDDLYLNSGLIQTDAYLPFTKVITVRGITLLGQDENTDAFMLKVAQTIEEMFPENDSNLDSTLQRRVIRSMYERKTVIPFFKGDVPVEFSGEAESQFDQVHDNNSLCDAIFEIGGDGQTMEVVEHILHHVTMVGLHYAFYDEWGVNRESTHYTQMQLAISSGYYNGDYGSQSSNERMRIYLQEYAYWVISSAWDIQQAYGGDQGGGEWTLASSDALSSSMPQMYSIYLETAAKVMKAPSSETLSWFRDL